MELIERKKEYLEDKFRENELREQLVGCIGV